MKKLTILTPAKINLFLEITGKRKDGYHDICSLIEKINLFDTIEFFPSDKNKVEFTGQWQIPEENTVSKTIENLCCLFPDISNAYPLRIVVHKNIPPGSGLGGASSDAAAVLKTCNLVWKLNLDEDSMRNIAIKIGSDVPLFLKDGPCIIEGKGEIVRYIERLPHLFFEVFVPDIQISTRMVYENVSEKQISDLTQAHSSIKIFLSAWKQNDIEKMEKLLFNRLEEVTLGINKEIGQFKNWLESELGKCFMLTGSGGGLYAIGKHNEQTTLKLPVITRQWKHYSVESYSGWPQKEEQHGNYRNKNFAD